MIDHVVTWLIAYPLQGVVVLAVFAGGVGALLVPKVHELVGHGHPRT